MYFPYFRGKQFELMTIRECAKNLAQSSFVPIIEPVKESLHSLKRALDAIVDANGQVILIANPQHGDHKNDGKAIGKLLGDDFKNSAFVSPGLRLTEATTVKDVVKFHALYPAQKTTLVHAGFSDAKALVAALGDQVETIRHAFIDKNCPKLYRKHFPGNARILIRDGFVRRNANRDYPDVEENFSDLHVTFKSEESMDGFGDFLVVGDDYSESGGPAYSVAIHLTFIDPDKDNRMFVFHFKSNNSDTPTDTAGKFSEALSKLINEIDSNKTKVSETSATAEFRQLAHQQHFPGLGYVKKLSMKHHIETLEQFFK